MRFSSFILWTKEEFQHFSKMTAIWYKIRHFHTPKKYMMKSLLYHRNFFTISLKIGTGTFVYVTIEKHSPPKTSFEKQWELSCAPNSSLNVQEYVGISGRAHNSCRSSSQIRFGGIHILLFVQQFNRQYSFSSSRFIHWRRKPCLLQFIALKNKNIITYLSLVTVSIISWMKRGITI